MLNNGSDSQNIIFFDGICGLCNKFVDFIILKDKKNIFTFCSLQSGFAKKKLEELKFDTQNIDSVVLLKNKQLYVKSKAVLEIFKILDYPYKIIYCINILVPVFISDSIYEWIANHRYSIFGKKNECRIPIQKEIDRFIV